MNVNRRTVTLLIVAIAVIGGVYAITWWQRDRETGRLLTEMQSTDHRIASEAITPLADRVPSVRASLIGLMQHDDSDVRWRSALILGEARDSLSRDALMVALSDEVPTVRAQAALALGKRNVRAAADRIALMAASDEEELEVRTAAVQALRMLRTSTHLLEVVEIAGDRPPPPPEEDDEDAEEYVDETALLRQEAVYAVAALYARSPAANGDLVPADNAISVLVASTDPSTEPNADVRRAACYALGDLAGNVREEEIHRSAVGALLSAMNDEVGDVRIAAGHTLQLVPVPANMRQSVNRAMEAAANDDHYWVRRAAERAVGGG